MKLHERIKKCRLENNMTLLELANALGVREATAQRYESGEIKNLKHATVLEMARIFNCSPAYLMGWEDDSAKKMFPDPNATSDYVTFPVIGEIAAGYDSVAIEDWSGETVDIPVSYFKGRAQSDFFVLEVKGDSMWPEYQEGDRVLILKQNTLEYSGQVGAILYDDTNSTLKKVEFSQGQDWLKLVPINPVFKPQRIEGEALEHCKVIGIPRVIIRDVKN